MGNVVGLVGVARGGLVYDQTRGAGVILGEEVL